MTHKIIVCTDRNLTWEALNRFAEAGPVTLERVASLHELAARQELVIDAVVVDDRFLPIIAQVERSARRHSAIYRDAVFMTAGEALNALWTGPLAGMDDMPVRQLAEWVAVGRMQSAA
ncbi:MAG: hypothetical protein ACM3Q1_11160 [Bacteroidales bacterium]